MSSGTGTDGQLNNIEEDMDNAVGDNDTDRNSEDQESDRESNICEGYYGSDRSDILDESECSFGSDVDFENYVTSTNQDLGLHGDSNDLWSKIDPSHGNLKMPHSYESNVKNNLPQLKNCPPRNSPPDSYFDLFFTSEVWNLFTSETNNFSNTPSPSVNWVNVSVSEMKKYFALILHMGLSRTLDFTYFWKEKSSMFLPYPSIMSLDRFKIISSKLHMSSQLCLPQTDVKSDYKSWTRVRPLLNTLNSSFMNFFIPAQDITVDESVYGIVPKYKSVFVSYTPKHHVEFGLKKYDLCDSSTGYVLQSTVLSKADFSDNNINPFMQKAIFSLVSDADLLNKYHHLFILNAYPKLSLVKTLLENKVYVTANVNKKTKELPKQVVQTKLNAGDTILFKSEKDNTVIVGFKNQKRSRYIVTSLLDDAEKVKERTGRKTPADFSESTPYYDAVDDWYKAIYDITCTRCTSKYWRKILYNLIDVTVLNSYILYTLNTDKPISKQKFISMIVRSLVGNLPELEDSGSEDDELDEFEDSESSDLSDFLMTDSDSKSDTESEEES